MPNTNRRWERISEKPQTPQESTGTRLVCKQKKHTSTIQTEQGHRKQADCQARAEHAMKERKQIQPPAIPQDTETSVDTRTNTSETQDKIETARRASAPTQQSGRVVKTPTYLQNCQTRVMPGQKMERRRKRKNKEKKTHHKLSRLRRCLFFPLKKKKKKVVVFWIFILFFIFKFLDKVR